MSKKQKLIDKLLSSNNTYKWSDLVALLTLLGYEPIAGRGPELNLITATLTN